MDSKSKKRLVWTIICGALVVWWPWAAMGWTGFRDLSAFASSDWVSFCGCMLLEAGTIIAFARLVHIAKKQQSAPEGREVSAYENSRTRLGYLVDALSVLGAAAAFCLGRLIWKDGPVIPPRPSCGVVLGGGALLALSVGAQYLLGKRIVARTRKMTVAQMQTYLLSHRENSDAAARKELRTLWLCRAVTDVIGVCMGILGLFTCFFAAQSDSVVIAALFLPFGAGFIEGLLYLVRFPASKTVFRNREDLLAREEYPELYALAEQAAAQCGVKGEIRLIAGTRPSVSIGQVGNTFLLTLGVVPLGILSREELYSILLHEFTHFDPQQLQANRVTRYMDWVGNGRNPGTLSGLLPVFFWLPDLVFAIHCELWYLASSIAIEVRADRAMERCPEAAAAALLKLKYYSLYDWEHYTEDTTSYFAGEEPNEHIWQQDVDRFLTALPHRLEDWEKLTRREIISRNATHPTTIMRVKSLGIEDFPSPFALPEGSYARECRSACAFMDALLGSDKKRYAEARKVRYFRPLEEVTAWEEAGRPLVRDEYADIVEDLRMLGRMSDAKALACRAAEELSASGGCYGRYIRGLYRLHSYDPAGLEDVQAAIVENRNYIENGLDEMGRFCCIMGLERELEDYRAMATEQLQRARDESHPMGALERKDDLRREELPEGMLEEILEFITSTGGEDLEKVYLVRKTVSETFFVSAFVLRFRKGTDPEKMDEVYHKVFRLLDSAYDWQFALFDYEDVQVGTLERVEGACVFERN